MMIRSASIFSQLLKIFDRNDFARVVRLHNAEKHSKGFSCWDQFVAMLFCQVAQAHSLREICGGLACCLGKLKHLGVSKAPNKSTLSYANEHRPWELYQTVFYQLLDKCRLIPKGKKKFRFKNKLLSLDATFIDLCLSLFPWAKFRQTKGAVKLHLLLDHDGYLPTFAHITDGLTAEVHVARLLQLSPGSIVVMDRAYNDYDLFGEWTKKDIYFVTRMKRGTDYAVYRRRRLPAERHQNIISDEEILLTGTNANDKCQFLLRRIKVFIPEQNEILVFLTNHMEFAASTIAAIYKERWQIELFFKAIKQNLKIKTFVGTSPNALKTQIWTALIAILLLKYLQLISQMNWSLSNMVALLRWNLFTYRDLWEWINDPFDTPPQYNEYKQLSFTF